MSERQEIIDACRRLALTPDGKALHLYLIRELLDCPPADMPDGALRAHHGRRNFARELIRMFEDESSGGSIGPTGPQRHTDGKPAVGEYAARRRGARRRIARRIDPS